VEVERSAIVDRRSTDAARLLRPYMPELDAVRGVAILMVLFFHGIAPPLGQPLSRIGSALFRLAQYGWTGVNLFFVLSGFLITGILLDSRGRADYFSRFYFRRALRILPALYVTLVGLRLGGWISWRFDALASLFLANCAPFFGLPLEYGPLWSLAVEEHFYMLWPSAVRKLSVPVLSGILLFILPGTIVLRFLRFAHGSSADALYSWFNLDGLALGALLAMWLRRSCFRRSYFQVFAPLAFVVGVVVFGAVQHNSLAKATLEISACNFASAGFLAGAMLAGTSSWAFLVHRPVLQLFGYVSYGLYLIHVLMFRVSEMMLGRLWPRLLLSGSPTFMMGLRFLTGASLALLLAYSSRRSLEDFFLSLGHPPPRLRADRAVRRPSMPSSIRLRS
jgi:peptidoglycan/LPS O-acetylase OafA/YrhL